VAILDEKDTLTAVPLRPPAQRLILILVITAASLAAGMSRIHDLDFWWHLQAGHLIAITHSIPHIDVFSYTAFGHEYIDHEWLFQLILYATYSAFGPLGIALLDSLLVAITMSIVALYVVGRGVGAVAAAGLVGLAIGAGISRVCERPELFSILFTVLTFIVADVYRRSGNWRVLIALPLLCALWSNIHAAVVVGLVVQTIFIGALIVKRTSPLLPMFAATAASVAACGANPFGYRVLSVPFELTRIIESGTVNNQEWQRATPANSAFLFLALLIVLLLLSRWWREVDLAALGVALFLGYLSLKYVRNSLLFSTMMPLLVAPQVARLSRLWRAALMLTGALTFAIVVTVWFPFERGIGESSYFPDRMCRYVVAHDLRGNMLNSYGFGGYFIWRLFPQRRVFIDGRNEVYAPLLARLTKSVSDSRAWSALLRDYRIEYALLNYVDQLDRVTTIDRSGQASVGYAPISSTRFPRSQWALVYWDDAGMVLVRRRGVNAALAATEYAHLFPEGRDYQRQLVIEAGLDRQAVIAELRRKLTEDPACQRARRLLDQVTGIR
jgi:hypothetical protein